MGRHSVIEASGGDLPLGNVPVPVPTQGSRTVTVPSFPPGFHAPPAGLDSPLPGPPPAAPFPPLALTSGGPRSGRARSGGARDVSVGTYIGAAGASVALVLVAGASLSALTEVAVSSAPSPTATSPAATSPAAPAPTAAAERCSDTVAGMLDDTVEELSAAPSPTWTATVAGQQGTLAATHGAHSAEYVAYTDGIDDVVAWLADSSSTETYSDVAKRVVPDVIATCDHAYA